MKSFSEYIKEDNDELNEKYNITPKSGGGGYLESFMNDRKGDAALKEIIKQIKHFIEISEEYAEEEGKDPDEQHKEIVEDILSYILNKVK